jgi:hypothetical protein
MEFYDFAATPWSGDDRAAGDKRIFRQHVLTGASL